MRYVYRVIYAGNKGQPLNSDSVFRDKTAAQEFAARMNGNGLRYGARVKRYRVLEDNPLYQNAI